MKNNARYLAEIIFHKYDGSCCGYWTTEKMIEKAENDLDLKLLIIENGISINKGCFSLFQNNLGNYKIQKEEIKKIKKEKERIENEN